MGFTLMRKKFIFLNRQVVGNSYRNNTEYSGSEKCSKYIK